MSDEREDFQTLLTHPGWLRVVDLARQEWNLGYGQKVKLAILAARTAQQDVGAAVDAVDRASDAVNALLSYPSDRLKHLEARREAQETLTPFPLSRRGSL